MPASPVMSGTTAVRNSLNLVSAWTSPNAVPTLSPDVSRSLTQRLLSSFSGGDRDTAETSNAVVLVGGVGSVRVVVLARMVDRGVWWRLWSARRCVDRTTGRLTSVSVSLLQG